MGIAVAMALICYVSSNPSPQQWLVSGRAEVVAQLDAEIATMAEVRRIAHAEDGDTAFSRYQMGANPPNRILWTLLRDAERGRMIYSRFQHIVPSCPSGRRNEVGDRKSLLTMALIGSAKAIRKLGLPPAAKERPVTLEDGRTGVGFALKDADRDRYDALVRRAATGTLPDVDLVLLAPTEQPGTGAIDPAGPVIPTTIQ